MPFCYTHKSVLCTAIIGQFFPCRTKKIREREGGRQGGREREREKEREREREREKREEREREERENFYKLTNDLYINTLTYSCSLQKIDK